MSDNSFNGWLIMTNLPHGWSVDKTAGSPLFGHVFIVNGKSVLNGQKRALMPVRKEDDNLLIGKNVDCSCRSKNESFNAQSYDEQIQDIGFRRTVNEMARESFKLNLLKDIMCDLKICEIEGWCKSQYIKEIKSMINEIGNRKTIIS